MALKDYADIVISFSAETVSRAGFGTLLFATEDETFDPGTVNGPYASLDEVLADYGVETEPYRFAQTAFSAGEGFSSLKIGHKDSEVTWVNGLVAIRSTDSDFYFLAIESRDQDHILSVAQFQEAQVGIFFAVSTGGSGAFPYTLPFVFGEEGNIGETLLDLNLSRTCFTFHDKSEEVYPEASWIAKRSPFDPGTINWAYATLPGIPTTKLTSAQRKDLRDNRVNYYESVAGTGITFAGYTSEPGVYVDIVRGLDWLTIRLQEDFIARQAAVSRIPYQGGDVVIEGLIRSRFDIAVDRGIITPDYVLNVPASANQAPGDRADRHFPGITFTANIVGAINTIAVRGTVSA